MARETDHDQARAHLPEVELGPRLVKVHGEDITDMVMGYTLRVASGKLPEVELRLHIGRDKVRSVVDRAQVYVSPETGRALVALGWASPEEAFQLRAPARRRKITDRIELAGLISSLNEEGTAVLLDHEGDVWVLRCRAGRRTIALGNSTYHLDDVATMNTMVNCLPFEVLHFDPGPPPAAAGG